MHVGIHSQWVTRVAGENQVRCSHVDGCSTVLIFLFVYLHAYVHSVVVNHHLVLQHKLTILISSRECPASELTREKHSPALRTLLPQYFLQSLIYKNSDIDNYNLASRRSTARHLGPGTSSGPLVESCRRRSTSSPLSPFSPLTSPTTTSPTITNPLYFEYWLNGARQPVSLRGFNENRCRTIITSTTL